MKAILFLLAADQIPGQPTADQLWGRAAFVAVFVLLLIGLILIPRRLIGQEGGAPPWWRNVRLWAIAIALVQIFVYIFLSLG